MRFSGTHGFPALRIEGGLLPSEFLQEIASRKLPCQRGSDYGLSPSLTIQEELSRYYRIATDRYKRYTSKARIDDWIDPLIRSILGYKDLAPSGTVQLDDRHFPLSHNACQGAVPFLLIPNGNNLDKPDSRFGQEGRRRAPHNLMQEYLNTSNGSLWGMVSNGSKLRILRDNVSITRPSYLEIDLDQVFTEDLFSDFSTLWLAAHASRLKPRDSKPTSCIIEDWRSKAHQTGERIRESLRVAVTESLRQLGTGFVKHPDNTRLRDSLDSGRLSPSDLYDQLLRLVYRLIFLLAVEDRNLLHDSRTTDAEKQIYTEGYSLSRIRERTLRRRHYDNKHDLWKGLQITFKALNEGAPPLGIPALGGLFHPDHCPYIDDSSIDNLHLLEAIRHLSFFESSHRLTRINYRDMGTEELGSVYESLLELHPSVDTQSHEPSFTFIEENTRGSKRKLTGSYYTPSSLVNQLIRTTLDPVIEQTIASNSTDPVSALLKLKIIDPACGSGHFLLAATRRLASELSILESRNTPPDEHQRQKALRQVVRHCIHGVDRNSLAVELCKVSLWIETIDPGNPLTFLDARIRHGDSLIGVLDPAHMEKGIPDDAYKKLTGDGRKVCRDLKKNNTYDIKQDLFSTNNSDVQSPASEFDSLPENSIDDVNRKRQAWKQELSYRRHSRLKADLFTSAYFARKTAENYEHIPLTEDILRVKMDGKARNLPSILASELGENHKFFHWYLEFSDVMQNGGFYVILGNPPWERIELQQQEFFATRSPEIAKAPNKSERDKLIRQLAEPGSTDAQRYLFQDFENARRDAEANGHFVRTSRRFPLTGKGDVNTYALFAELFIQLVHPQGRSGIIVPTGIATDNTTKHFFDHVISNQRIASLYDLENKLDLFPNVHSSFKFCLVTLCGSGRHMEKTEFSFFITSVEQLKEHQRRFQLIPNDFKLFNPNTRTCPIFRTRRDMEISRKIYERSGVLWNEARGNQEEDNPWGVNFSSMFNMSNDSHLFMTRDKLENDGWKLNGNMFVQGEERYLPLYEAKMFFQYNHRFATFDSVSPKDIANGNARISTIEEKHDPNFVSIPRYWILEKHVTHELQTFSAPSLQFQNASYNWQKAESREPGFIVLRLICRSTDIRTAICTQMPRSGVNHKAVIIKINSGSQHYD